MCLLASLPPLPIKPFFKSRFQTGNLNQNVLISCPVAVTKYPDESDLRKKGLLDSQLQTRASHFRGVSRGWK